MTASSSSSSCNIAEMINVSPDSIGLSNSKSMKVSTVSSTISVVASVVASLYVSFSSIVAVIVTGPTTSLSLGMTIVNDPSSAVTF